MLLEDRFGCRGEQSSSFRRCLGQYAAQNQFLPSLRWSLEQNALDAERPSSDDVPAKIVHKQGFVGRDSETFQGQVIDVWVRFGKSDFRGTDNHLEYACQIASCQPRFEIPLRGVAQERQTVMRLQFVQQSTHGRINLIVPLEQLCDKC